MGYLFDRRNKFSPRYNRETTGKCNLRHGCRYHHGKAVSTRDSDCPDRSAPSAATLTISLTLRAALDFLKAYATHLNGLPRLRTTWLDLPSVTTSAASVVGVISEAVGPGRTGGPTSARAPGSLALWAPFCFFKTETVLHLRVDGPLCFNSPLVLAASTSIVGVVSKWFRPCRTVAPATARVRRSLTLRAAFSFFKADPKTPLTSPGNWRPADD